jgi:hypothetical protein
VRRIESDRVFIEGAGGRRRYQFDADFEYSANPAGLHIFRRIASIQEHDAIEREVLGA